MIPVAERAADVVNTLGGEVLDLNMSSAPEDMIHYMTLFTNIYSDNETAVIREYSTNALDAQVEVGVSKPIEVTTPTVLNPYLRIKDAGCGISSDDFRHMWRTYGKSTKRDKEDQNGSQGIGAKSGLAYTNQFSIISVKNGVKVHVSISRKETGGAAAEIVSEIATDEPNGTEIVIPAARYNSFGDKAKRLFRYWEKGTVLLNGEDPSQRDKLIPITDRIFQNPFDNYNDIIFMGNVPYPVKGTIGTLRLQGHGIVAFIGMNSKDQVKFAPSRESLTYNDQTNAVIARLTEEYDKRALIKIKDDIDKCTSHPEAFKVYRQHVSSYSNLVTKDYGLKFKGESFPDTRAVLSFTKPPLARFDGEFVQWAPSKSRQVTFRWKTNWSSTKWVVYNYPNSSLPSGDHRRKTRMYVTDVLNKGFGGGNVVYIHNAQPKDFDDYKWYADRFIDWNEIRKIRFKTDRAVYAKSDDWKVQDTAYGNTVTRNDIKSDQRVIYWSSAKDQDIPSNLYDVLTRHYPDAIMIREPITRHPRLVREFPNSMTLGEAKAVIRKKLEKVGISVKDQMIHESKSVRLLGVVAGLLPYGTIHDKRLTELAAMYDGKTDYSQNTKDLMVFNSNPFRAPSADVTHYVSNNYPLLSHVNSYGLGAVGRIELIYYINQKYNERKAK